MSALLTHFNYVTIVVLMMVGLFIVFATGNFLKRMIGLALFQTTTGLFFISLGKVEGGTAPIIIDAKSEAGQALASAQAPTQVAQFGVEGVVYSNPLPHVLILTAIVVGLATLAVGLAIAVRVREAYGTVEADEIAALARVDAANPQPEPAP